METIIYVEWIVLNVFDKSGLVPNFENFIYISQGGQKCFQTICSPEVMGTNKIYSIIYNVRHLKVFSLPNVIFHINSCVGFDSGCVRRQMDNFVHDLISANHDSDFENLIIWGWTL